MSSVTVHTTGWLSSLTPRCVAKSEGKARLTNGRAALSSAAGIRRWGWRYNPRKPPSCCMIWDRASNGPVYVRCRGSEDCAIRRVRTRSSGESITPVRRWDAKGAINGGDDAGYNGNSERRMS